MWFSTCGGVSEGFAEGSRERIITDAGKPNGVAVSPDQKRLYGVSNDNGALDLFRLGEGMTSHKGRMDLLVYNLEPDGKATFSRVLKVAFSPSNHFLGFERAKIECQAL